MKEQETGLEWDSLLLLLFRCCYSIYVNVFCENPSTHTSIFSYFRLLLLLPFGRPASQPARQPTLARWHWLSWLCTHYAHLRSLHAFVCIFYMGTPIHLVTNDKYAAVDAAAAAVWIRNSVERRDRTTQPTWKTWLQRNRRRKRRERRDLLHWTISALPMRGIYVR